MPIEFINDDHFGRIYPPEPGNTMMLKEFSGSEAVNEISVFKLSGETKKPVDLDKFIGKGIRVELQTGENKFRHFHQIIFSARDLGRTGANAEDEAYGYEFELRPWIWAASRAEASRIFHKKSLEQILRTTFEVVTKFDGCKLEFSVRKPPPVLEYTVQFNETNLNFALRLMEEFGLNYHCRMEKSGHTIVISDNVDAFDDVDGKERAHFGAEVLGDKQEFFSTWLPQRNFTTGKTRTLDYNFEEKSSKVSSESTSSKSYAASDQESFHYDGRIKEKSVGDDLAKRRLDSMRMGDSQVRCSGSLPSLGAGMKVKIVGAVPASENGTFACLSANHHYVHGASLSNNASDNSYDGAYMLTREDAPIAPKKVTPAAVMLGPQTAIVTTGAHDAVDKYGRIKVRFHWQSDTEDSMYCRVSQMWAGSGWGAVFIPQTGMEVIVEFLGGQPDRPIITGCVYNATNMPPWDLPGNKKISGIKTVAKNQISFDDTGGSELIEMIGTKDMKVDIKKDTNTTIGKDQTLEVTGDVKETVTGSITIESKKSIILKVQDSKIEIGPASIKISSLSIEVSAQVSMVTKGGATAEHSAGGQMTVKGAIVMIN